MIPKDWESNLGVSDGVTQAQKVLSRAFHNRSGGLKFGISALSTRSGSAPNKMGRWVVGVWSLVLSKENIEGPTIH